MLPLRLFMITEATEVQLVESLLATEKEVGSSPICCSFIWRLWLSG